MGEGELPSDARPNVVVLDVGELLSLDELHFRVAGSLRTFIQNRRRGNPCDAVWDLRNVWSRREHAKYLNLGAATTLAAIAHLVRRVANEAVPTYVTTDPYVLAFLDVIGFFELGRRYDLFAIDREHRQNRTPDRERIAARTRANIKSWHPTSAIPSPLVMGMPEWFRWKGATRSALTAEVHDWVRDFINPTRAKNLALQNLSEQLSKSISELIMNAWIWGNAPAFTGVQRAKGRVSVAVADAGMGFLRSMRSQVETFDKPMYEIVRSDVDAVELGCLVNNDAYALHGAIRLVVSGAVGDWTGWIKVGSMSASVHWEPAMWQRIRHQTPDRVIDMASAKQATAAFESPLTKNPTDATTRGRGFVRQWPEAFPGSRVDFEIRFDEPEVFTGRA